MTVCIGSSSESWEPQQPSTSMALTCRVEEPSTASLDEIGWPSSYVRFNPRQRTSFSTVSMSAMCHSRRSMRRGGCHPDASNCDRPCACHSPDSTKCICYSVRASGTRRGCRSRRRNACGHAPPSPGLELRARAICGASRRRCEARLRDRRSGPRLSREHTRGRRAQARSRRLAQPTRSSALAA